MDKSKPTKKEKRDEINAQVEAFLREKGEIKQFNMGDTGLINGKFHHEKVAFSEPKQTRTPLNHVVADIENRKRSPKPPPIKKSRPKKKVIYDDFGEPIRWYWEE